MESSGYAHPSTSERARRSHGPTRIAAHKDRAPSGHVEQEEGPAVSSYERFLELPVAGVLAVMWVAGAALLGSCALTLYLLGSSLLQILN
jgi:type VI protein secretion system component VasF